VWLTVAVLSGRELWLTITSDLCSGGVKMFRPIPPLHHTPSWRVLLALGSQIGNVMPKHVGAAIHD
jgi:hypothetical protein